MTDFEPVPYTAAVSELEQRVTIYDMPPAPLTFSCLRCKDIGEVPDFRSGVTPAGGKGTWIICPECGGQNVLERRYQRLISKSRIPEKLLSRTLETFDTERGSTEDARATLRTARAEAERFAANPENWLLFHGEPGTGKTHLMVGIAQRCIPRGIACLFQTVPDLLAMLRASYSDEAEMSFNDLSQLVRDCPVLLMDDLGTERMTEWAQEQMFTLINHRYNAGLPTVISTNLNPDPYHEHHGNLHPRLWSRMAGQEISTVLELKGGDKRQSRPASTWTRDGARDV
jgi:DNA replication protein DnaC